MRTLARLTARRYTMNHIPSSAEALALFDKLDHASQLIILDAMRKCIEKYEADEKNKSQAF